MGRWLCVFILTLLVCGCDAEITQTRQRDAGTFVSVRKEPTAWNEPLIMTVTTTKGEFQTVQGTVSGFVDDPCFVRSYSDGTSYLFIGDGRGTRIQ